MNPITPWLDPDEVRQLAASLLRRPEPPLEDRVADPGFGKAFVGYVVEGGPLAPERLPVTPVAATLPAPVAPVPSPPSPHPSPVAPEPVAPTPLPPPPAPPPAPLAPAPAAVVAPPAQPVVAASGPFLDRIGRFRDWLRQYFEASGVFILDREGGVIFDESGHGKLHFLARSLALTSRRPGNPAANVHVKIGATATLEVIPVETPYGWFVLGAVVPEPMAPAAVAVIMEALARVAAPPRPAAGS
ncbi:MAG: hypothetical protein MUF04_08850 [Akkermansiaceae bacterium]|nr:hypothetical protein [Akkermansiaceae bacterium]